MTPEEWLSTNGVKCSRLCATISRETCGKNWLASRGMNTKRFFQGMSERRFYGLHGHHEAPTYTLQCNDCDRGEQYAELARPKPVCECGAPVHAKGKCRRCYNAMMMRRSRARRKHG